jgi:hypothetical protein
MSDSYPSPPSPQRASLGAKFLLSVFGLILAGAGGFFSYQMWNSYQRAAVTYQWTETPCQIVESKIEEERVNLSSPVQYVPYISYSYLEDDTAVIGAGIKRVPGLKFKEKAMAEELVNQYPAGRGAKCYVNPADPKEVILVRETKAALYSIWFPLLFVIGGLGMVINVWWPEGREDAVTTDPTAKA